MFHEFTWWGQEQLWPTYRPTVNNPSNVKDDKLALFKSRSGTCLWNAMIHHAFALVNYIDELKINSGSKWRPKLSGGGMFKSTCIGCTRLIKCFKIYMYFLYRAIFIPPQTKLRGYVRPFVRSSVRPSQSPPRPLNRISWNFQELFTPWCHTAPPILNFIRMIFGFPRAKQGLCHYDIGGGASIIRCS